MANFSLPDEYVQNATATVAPAAAAPAAFTLPNDVVSKAVDEYKVDPNYNPHEAALQAQPGSPEWEHAFLVNQAREGMTSAEKKKYGLEPSTSEKLKNAGAGAVQFGVGLVAAPVLGTASIIAQNPSLYKKAINVGSAAVGVPTNLNDEAGPLAKKLQSDSVLAAEKATNPIARAFSDFSKWYERNSPIYDDNPSTDSLSMEGDQFAPKPKDVKTQQARDDFANAVQRYKEDKGLEQGRVQDTGAFAEAAKGVGFAPSDAALTPERQKELGVETSPTEKYLVDAASTAENPENALFALAPEVPGVAAGLKAAGTGLEFAGKGAAKVVGKIPVAAKATGGALGVAGVGYELYQHPIEATAGLGLAGTLMLMRPAGTFIRGAGELAGGMAPAEGASALGLRAKQMLAGGVGGSVIGAATSPEDPEQGAYSGFAMGAGGGALHSPYGAQVAGKRAAMEQFGDSIRTGNDAVDATHQAIVGKFDPAAKAALDRYRAAAIADGTHLVVTDQAGFNAAMQANGQPDANGVRGVTVGDDKHILTNGPNGSRTIYINADTVGGESGFKGVDTAGHELGHAVVDYLKAQSSKAAADALTQAVASNLTDAEKAEIASKYGQAINAQTTNAPVSPVDENIAEITRKLLAKKDIAEFGLPETLAQKIKGSVSDFFEGTRGDGGGMKWGTKEIVKARRLIEKALYDQGARATAMRQRASDVAAGKVEPNVLERQKQIAARISEIDGLDQTQVTPSILEERAKLTKQASDLAAAEAARTGQTPATPSTGSTIPTAPTGPTKNDLLTVKSALVAMGYPARVSEQMAQAAQGGTVEELIKDALARKQPTPISPQTAPATPAQTASPAAPAPNVGTLTPQTAQGSGQGVAAAPTGQLSGFAAPAATATAEPAPLGLAGFSVPAAASGEAVMAEHPVLGFGNWTPEEMHPQLLSHPESRQIYADGQPTDRVLGEDGVMRDSKPEDRLHPQWEEPTYTEASLRAARKSNNNAKPTEQATGASVPAGGSAVSPGDATTSATPSGPTGVTRPVSSPEEVSAAVGAATAAAKATPEYDRALKKKEKAKAAGDAATEAQADARLETLEREARLDALKKLLPRHEQGSGPAPDELHVSSDNFGNESIKGKIDESNPVHREIMAHGEMSPEEIARVKQLQDRTGAISYIDYGSAAKEDNARRHGEQRRTELAASPAQERVEGVGEVTEQKNKAVIPVGNTVTAAGRVNTVALSPDKILSNLGSVVRAATEHGLPNGDFSGRPEALNNLAIYLRNHRNGFSGDGITKVDPTIAPNAKGESLVDAHGQPVDLETAEARMRVFNMAMHDTRATTPARAEAKQAAYAAAMQAWTDGGEQGPKPRKPRELDPKTKFQAEEGQALAKRYGAMDETTGETNPLRADLEKAGYDPAKELESPWENLRPELIRDIRDAADGKQEIVRPHRVAPEDIAGAVTNPPSGKATLAGFMPGEGKIEVQHWSEDAEDYDPWEVADKAEKVFRNAGLRPYNDSDLSLVAFGKDGEPIGATYKRMEKVDAEELGGPEGETVNVYKFDIGVDPKEQGGTVGYMLTKKAIQDARSEEADVMKNWVINEKMAEMLEKFFGFEYDEEPSRRDGFSANMTLWLDGRQKGRSDLPKFMPGEMPGDEPSIKSKEQLSDFKTDKLGFYSGLGKIVDDKLPNKATGEQILGILKNNGAKAEEMEAMGLPEFLQGRKGVTKQEIQDFVDAGGVKLKEVTKGGEGEKRPAIVRADNGAFIDWADEDSLSGVGRRTIERAGRRIEDRPYSEAGPTKFSQYTLPGGKNYKEVVLTLPQESKPKAPLEWKENASGKWAWFQGERQVSGAFPEVGQAEQARRSISGDVNRLEGFQSPHFPNEEGYLAHLRTADHTDTQGRDGMVIEEIQSDLHQKGRKEGYQNPKRLDELDAKLKREGKLSSEEGEEYNRLTDLENFSATKGGVPDAPFKKTWHELAFKRALRMAVESGKDFIGWVDGKTQAERYDLSKVYDSIEAEKLGDGKYMIEARGKGGEYFKETYPAEKLPDVLGKELAEKIVNRPERPTQDQILEAKQEYDAARKKWGDEGGSENEVAFKQARRKYNDLLAGDTAVQSFSGVDLKVGGEGMKGFYDKMLPDFVRNYVKKWGGKVETAQIGTGDAKDFNQEITHDEALAIVNNGGRVLADSGTDKRVLTTPYEVNTYSKGGAYQFKSGEDAKTIHSVTITPAMREAVMKGQPLFMPDAEGGASPEGKKPLEDFRPEGAGMQPSIKSKIVSTVHPREYSKYLRGECDIMAKALSKKLDLPLYGLFDKEGDLHHVFVADESTDTAYDARGSMPINEIGNGSAAEDGEVRPVTTEEVEKTFGTASQSAIKKAAKFFNENTKNEPSIESKVEKGQLAGFMPSDFSGRGEVNVKDRSEETDFSPAAMKQRRLADFVAQKPWLDEQAQQLGYEDSDALNAVDSDKFNELAEQWRAEHPREDAQGRQLFMPGTGEPITGVEAAGSVDPKDKKAAMKAWLEKGTASPYFKQWFGKSKVVDDNGKPLMVTSGHSNVELYGDAYNPKKGTAGGFYATEDPDISSNYSTGKMGVREEYEHGSQYRFQQKNGKFGKKIWQVELTPEQVEKARAWLKHGEDDGDSSKGSDLGLDIEKYWKENAPYDATAKRATYRGIKDLQSIYDTLEYMGYNIAYADEPTAAREPLFMRQNKNSFEELLDHLGIKWQSHDWSQPGVQPLYLRIENPLDADKPFPPDLLAALDKASKRERTKPFSMDSTWTKDYPLKQWVADIKSGDEYWSTHIPAKALPIIKQFGYDGIKERGNKGAKDRAERQINWIAFDPEQIKSVNNRGTFDDSDPNMLMMPGDQDAQPKRTWFMRDGKRVYHQRHPDSGQFVPKQTLARFQPGGVQSSSHDKQPLADFAP